MKFLDASKLYIEANKGENLHIAEDKSFHFLLQIYQPYVALIRPIVVC